MSADIPDRAFSLGTVSSDIDRAAAPSTDAAAAPPADESATRARELTQRIAEDLAAAAPEGWQRLEAVFALTSSTRIAQVRYHDTHGVVRSEAPDSAVRSARAHRELSARPAEGPWWRLLIGFTADGRFEVEYDYGDEPFPDDHMFAPEAYLADLEQYPRHRIPVWLAAYAAHAGRQLRTPQQAAAGVRADRVAGVAATASDAEFPDLPVLWSRWATLAAAFVATGSEQGPRVSPSVAWFGDARRSGSTLCVLPGDRAVLSGGVWDAPELDEIYNDGADMPNYYAGAPSWVCEPLVNPRARAGLLTFCYWWSEGHWWRGDSPAAERFVPAIPAIRTTESLITRIAGLAANQPGNEVRSAVTTLIDAAEAGRVTETLLREVFPGDGFDIDSALHQFSLAGLLADDTPRLDMAQALAAVRTTGYPSRRLRAERVAVGWMIHDPTRPDDPVMGRTVFYVADDRVIERSSASIAPQVYLRGFEQRYRLRRGTASTRPADSSASP